MNTIEILSAGLYTSIQDLGRFGAAQYGVPKSGVMDSFSAQKANLLVNNSLSAAVLEITMQGPKLYFNIATTIAITGAVFQIKLDNRILENDKAYAVPAGSILVFGELMRGFRAYMAFFGGIHTPKILGSRSQYEGITTDFRLKIGDFLELNNRAIERSEAKVRVQFRESGIFEDTIDLMPGPEFYLLSEIQREQLQAQAFTILPNSNRMAIQVKELIKNELDGILTGPVLPGTLQLTPKGKLVILMRDCQISGGYPRVGQLTEMGINTLAQKMPGESVFFHMAAK